MCDCCSSQIRKASTPLAASRTCKRLVPSSAGLRSVTSDLSGLLAGREERMALAGHCVRGGHGRFPSAAQGFDQLDRSDQLLCSQVYRRALIVQQGSLRGDDVQVAVDAETVAVVGEREIALRRFYGGILFLKFLRAEAERGQAVFDFLKTCEHGLAIVRDGALVACPRLFGHGFAFASVENRFCQCRADGPREVWPGNKISDRSALVTHRAAQRDRREVRGARDANL